MARWTVPLVAAAIVIPAPAAALDPAAGSAMGVNVHRGSSDRFEPREPRGDHRGERRRGRGPVGGLWINHWSGGADQNRSWDAESYNDWWHERPWRSYPRWVQQNDGCTPDRMWQGGGSWRCSW